MLNLATATADLFTPHLGTPFTLTPAPFPVTLTLDAVRPLGPSRPDAKREAFALTFRGQPGLRIAQRIYHFDHATLGPMEIFITQLADNQERSLFEAVFN